MPTNPDARVTQFDAAEYIDDVDAVLVFLNDAFESGDAGVVADAIGVVARARGMSRIAASADLSRESLYKSLSVNGNPELTTLLAVLDALGLKLVARQAAE